MPTTEPKSERKLVSIRSEDHELLEQMRQSDTRSQIDQLSVIIREAAEKRGLIKPSDSAQPTDTTVTPVKEAV